MALPEQHFSNITQGHFAAIVAEVKTDTGVVIESDAGTASSPDNKYTFTWNFDPLALTLTVQCLKKPLYIPTQMLLNGLAEKINAIQG